MSRNGKLIHRQLLIAHSSPLVIEALASIAGALGFSVGARHTDGDAAREAMRDGRFDLAILGCGLGTVGGIDLLRERRASDGKTILICPAIDHRQLLAAVELGVDGLLTDSAPVDAVQTCVSMVADGRQWIEPSAMTIVLERAAARPSDPSPALTKRERDVAKLVAAGQRNRTIAETLGISEGTVKMHLHNVYAKLGLESRTQLAMDERARAI